MSRMFLEASLLRDTKGLTTPEIEGKFALRASVTGQIFLDNVFVPKDKNTP